MEQRLLLEIEEALRKKEREALKQKYEIRVSKKLGLNDTAFINGEYKKVFCLIETSPIALWNHIYTRGTKTSLTQTAYAKLKMAVSKINPDHIEENTKKRSQHNALKKFNREANNGTLGTPHSKFHKKEP
jgi:hypothetical protein